MKPTSFVFIWFFYFDCMNFFFFFFWQRSCHINPKAVSFYFSDLFLCIWLLSVTWCFSMFILKWLLDARKRRRRSGSLVLQKKRRRLLPFVPTEDPAQRLKQMGSLASALTALHMEFSDDLSYMHGMAPRSANQAKFESGGMQVWTWNFSFSFVSHLNFWFSLLGLDDALFYHLACWL